MKAGGKKVSLIGVYYEDFYIKINVHEIIYYYIKPLLKSLYYISFFFWHPEMFHFYIFCSMDVTEICA